MGARKVHSEAQSLDGKSKRTVFLQKIRRLVAIRFQDVKLGANQENGAIDNINLQKAPHKYLVACWILKAQRPL